MYLELLSMKNRNAVVVGAGGGGHGTAVALALAEAGARVIALDASADALGTLEAEMAAGGYSVVPMQADARDTAQVDRVLDEVTAKFGAIHSLTNVVGGTRPHQWARVDECSDEIFDAVFDMNLRTAFVTCRASARRMIAAGTQGSIVNISSVSGLVSAPEHGPYGAAKSAMVALSRTMAVEWSGHGIRVNVVAPGSMSVPRLAYLHAATESLAAASIPLGRRGSPADVAGAVLFLHSGLASYVTGEVLAVDGGLMAKTPFESEVVRSMGPNRRRARQEGDRK